MKIKKTAFGVMAAAMLMMSACTAQTAVPAPKPSAQPPAGANPTAVSASGVFSGSVTSANKPITGTVTAGNTVATPKAGSSGVLSGTVSYKERIALAPDSVATVRLVDVTQADAPGIVLAEQVIKNPGAVPIKYELKYDTSKISAKNRYTVQAIIADGAGKVAWANETRYPALTGGAPLSGIEIVVKQGVVPAATVAQVTATPKPADAAPVTPTAKSAATVVVTPTAKPAATTVPAATAVVSSTVIATPAPKPTVVVTATTGVTTSGTATGTLPAPVGAVITGTASYAQNVALQPDSTATVVLYEMSASGVGIRAVARQTISITGNLPAAWKVSYDPAKLKSGVRYGVIVTVNSGRNMYRNSRPAMVISRTGETASVDVAMRKVR